MIPKNPLIRETEQSRDVTRSKSSNVKSAKDTVSIGEESKIVSRLISRLKEIQNAERPDLESLKDDVKAGLYKPSPADVAHAILFGPPKIK